MLRAGRERLGAVLRRQHSIAIGFEGRFRRFKDRCFIINHQHELSIPLVEFGPFLFGLPRGGCLLGRQVDLELGSSPHLAVHIHKPAMAFHEPHRGRETQPGSLPHPFSGEEGVKNPVDHVGGNPGAGIQDGQHHIGAGFGVRLPPQVMFVKEQIARLNLEPPAIRHRIAGVDAQVQQHLIELGRITDDGPEVIWEVRPDLN